ncbi:MAG TPA: exodeoxyribonuclease III [Thermoanaerobaculia bacterium]|jgi:exodeoxyribonuclease-3|nr:exodeoxyribonuclease III [Thermoanaerobaculia bacterium]
MSTTVATWNVNGIRAREAQFLEWVGRDRPDVICLQEIKASPEKLSETVCSLEGYWCYWHGAGGYSGVGLNLRRDRFPEEPRYEHPSFDHETRIVTATVGDLTFASVYVPNGGKDYEAKLRFLDAMTDYAADLQASGRTLVLCGDLNVTLTDRDVHPKERKPGVIGQRSEERERLSAILSHGLVDVGRALDPDNDGLFTWWAPWRNMKQRNIGWRIDYILASRPLAERATASRVLADVGTSDHAPVVASFDY